MPRLARVDRGNGARYEWLFAVGSPTLFFLLLFGKSFRYILFVEQPVIVEKLWLSRDLPLDGHAAFPIILRGRHNVEEYWSVYLRYVDFLEQTWVSPAVTPVPISEIVILGGQGLRIGSLYLGH